MKTSAKSAKTPISHAIRVANSLPTNINWSSLTFLTVQALSYDPFCILIA